MLRATILLTASLASSSSGFSVSAIAPRVGRSVSAAVRSLSMATSSSDSAVAATAEPSLPSLSPTAKRLFLVRHGEVVNPGGEKAVLYGAMDVPLSELGRREAQAAADYLSQFSLTNVFCSPLSRAIYGAEQILERQKKQNDGGTPTQVTVLDGFKELDRGDWCGMTVDEIGDDLWGRFNACDETATPANGESFVALKARVMEAHRHALERMQPGDMACIVSHLQVTRCMLSDAMNVATSEMTDLKVATASVTCIDYDGDETFVRFRSFKPEAGLEASVDGAN